MGDKSKIEWTDATWNPIRARNKATGGVGHYCVHASEGCRNCYAERLQPRFKNPIRYALQDRDKVELFLDEKTLTQPLRWQRPRKIFVCSMTDLFADFVPDEMIHKVFAMMALCPHHTFQVLTKRPERMRAILSKTIEIRRASETRRHPEAAAAAELFANLLALNRGDRLPWRVMDTAGYMYGFHADMPWPLQNVWLGVSVEDQKTAGERIPLLLDTPSAKRWVSAEPLLGPIDLTDLQSGKDFHNALSGCSSLYDPDYEGQPPEEAYVGVLGGPRLAGVVLGGESGPGARPMHPDWARRVRDDCAAAGVPYFFKQWGESRPGSDLLNRPGKAFCLDRTGRVVSAPAFAKDFPQGAQSSDGWVWMRRVGKKAAGAMLDGVEHREFPA